MSIPWDQISHLQNFFRLDFLFSGLEVSTTQLFMARLVVFLALASGVIWAVFRIVLKALDCLQTLLAQLAHLPASFFLLLLLAAPLSSDSVGSRWIGYILLVLGILGLALVAALMLVMWKYGVDQALRVLDSIRSRAHETNTKERAPNLPPDNIMTVLGEKSRPASIRAS
ncbi:MAG: hypothetical protein FJ118_18935 [Deltaproteobacteria bacterium]|nr:hypothetical protein [Deltaproteobacteria bacterium]